MVSRWLLCLITILATRSATGAPQSLYPSDEVVRAIESQMIMPDGAKSLDLYDRYYFFPKHGRYTRDLVEGTYLLRSGFPVRKAAIALTNIPGAFVVLAEDQPVIADGGCGVVTILFDLTTQRLAKLKMDDDEPAQYGLCNGRA